MNASLLLNIPLANIELNPVALREVDRDSNGYKFLRDSMKREGLINPISVVPATLGDGRSPKTREDGSLVYRVADGAHRFTAATELGFESIEAKVLNKDEVGVMRVQLIGNLHRIPTKHYEYSQHLVTLLGHDQTMSKGELAAQLNITPDWLDKKLGLVNLHEEAGKLVDSQKINLSNAIELAKLRPVEEQLNFITAAIEDSTQVFTSKIKSRMKEIRDAKRAGRDPNAKPVWAPTAHNRKKGDIELEAASPSAVMVFVQRSGATTPEEIVRVALQWAVHLDPVSVAEARAKEEARIKRDEADKAKRAADRAKQKQDEANAKLAALSPTTTPSA